MKIRRAQVENALLEVQQEEEPALARAVAHIVWANAEQGRLAKFLAAGDVADERDYVRCVVSRYREQYDYVRRLQESEDAQVWEALFTRLQKRAYGVLTKKQFLIPGERYEHAVQCATDAALVIARRRFPFDTYFHAWANVVVYYVCGNHVRQARNGRSVPDEAQVSLDAWDGWLQNVADPAAEVAHSRVEQRHDLLQQVATLAEAQRNFVMLYYFEQKSYEEIAALMGRSKNALYKLHFDALTNLRQKMLLNQTIYE